MEERGPDNVRHGDVKQGDVRAAQVPGSSASGPERSALYRRLSAIRTTIRRRLVLYGMFAVLAGGVAAYMTIVAFDWWLDFPGALRVIVSLVYAAGFVGATLHWIVAPLRAGLDVEAVAGRLERHFQPLRDRLTSTVSFLRGGENASPAMVARVVENTERIVRDVPLESAITARPMMRSAAAFAVMTVALVGITWLVPGWTSTGWKRYTDPFGATRWPTLVKIVPLTHDTTVAVGESVGARMRIVRGGADDLRGLVYLRDPDGRVNALTMTTADGAVFETTIDAVTRSLECWFAAGDDSTRDEPFRIEVVRRPVVTEASAVVDPPPYAAGRPSKRVNFAEGPVQGTIGGRVTVEVLSTKPVDADASRLDVEGGPDVPLISRSGEGRYLAANFTLTEDMRFRIRLVDREGFENRGEPERVIRAVPDAPPVVAVERPLSVVEVTPSGIVDLAVRIEDDFGVAGAVLTAGREGHDEARVDVGAGLVRESNDDRVVARLAYGWRPVSVDAVPGEVVTLHVVATDNRSGAGLTPQETVSAPVYVRVISKVEFDMRLRDDIAMVERQLRDVLSEQVDIQDRTAATLYDLSDASEMTTDARESSATVGGRQSRLARRMGELAERFRSIAARMGGAGEMAQSRDQIEELARVMASIGDESMRGAVERLREAYLAQSAAEGRRLLEQGQEGQIEAADEIRGLLASMARWGNFQTIVTKTRDALQRQADLRARTQDVGREMIGKPLDSLSDEEAAAILKLKRAQEQLGEEIAQLLESMGRMARQGAEADPTGAEASEDALRAARAHDVERFLNEAAAEVGRNRTAAAVVAQRKIERGLEKSLRALEQRDTRELQQLAKKSEEAQERLANLIEDQKALRDATAEAAAVGADAETAGSLRDQQAAIRRNASAVADDLGRTEGLADAQRLVRSADPPMEDAVQRLGAAETAQAVGPQGEAVAALEAALEELFRVQEEAEREVLDRTLGDIREALSGLVAAQEQINPGLSELVAAVADRGRVGRAEAREATRLSRLQGEFGLEAQAVMTDIERVPVYKWALENVTELADSIRGSLLKRRIEEDLAVDGSRIVDRLGQLIAAIDETTRLPKASEFEEGEASGGGRGQAGAEQASKPIPPLAELLVLKTIQLSINEETKALYESIDMADVTEAELARISRLAEDQADVRALTERVISEGEQR